MTKIGTKKTKTLFVAYSWDLYVRSMYEDIFKILFEEWDIRHGSDVTLKDTEASEVEKFMNRNKHLYDVFVSAIESSDFFIADVTKTNPNVMLELGIAMQLNKNILIVTSEKLDKLPFDISGFKVNQYRNKEELTEIIKKELDIFNKIQSQTFSKHFNGFYFPYPSEGELHHQYPLIFPIPRAIRNLRFKCEYKFLSESNSHDWFGVHLRAKQQVFLRSELVYVRKNKKLELVSFPGQSIPIIGGERKAKINETKDGFSTLELLIKENIIHVFTNDSELESDKLQIENPGLVVIHVYAHNQPTLDNLKVRYRNVEILSLDTTHPL